MSYGTVVGRTQMVDLSLKKDTTLSFRYIDSEDLGSVVLIFSVTKKSQNDSLIQLHTVSCSCEPVNLCDVLGKTNDATPTWPTILEGVSVDAVMSCSEADEEALFAILERATTEEAFWTPLRAFLLRKFNRSEDQKIVPKHVILSPLFVSRVISYINNENYSFSTIEYLLKAKSIPADTQLIQKIISRGDRNSLVRCVEKMLHISEKELVDIIKFALDRKFDKIKTSIEPELEYDESVTRGMHVYLYSVFQREFSTSAMDIAFRDFTADQVGSLLKYVEKLLSVSEYLQMASFS